MQIFYENSSSNIDVGELNIRIELGGSAKANENNSDVTISNCNKVENNSYNATKQLIMQRFFLCLYRFEIRKLFAGSR